MLFLRVIILVMKVRLQLRDMTDNLILTNFKVVVDRYEAIKCGIEIMSESSILLVLGKGHESYQR